MTKLNLIFLQSLPSLTWLVSKYNFILTDRLARNNLCDFQKKKKILLVPNAFWNLTQDLKFE